MRLLCQQTMPFTEDFGQVAQVDFHAFLQMKLNACEACFASRVCLLLKSLDKLHKLISMLFCK